MGGYARSNNARMANHYRGRCSKCGLVIGRGQDSHWATGQYLGLVHDDCVPPPPDPGGTAATLDIEPASEGPASSDACAA